MRQKLGEWGRRYLPLEIAATFAALAGGLGVACLTANPVAIAYAGTWSENAGYYGMAVWREMRAVDADGGGDDTTARSWTARVATTTRRLLWEFGAAELIDSFVARPFCLYWAMAVAGNVGVGLVAGKLAADLVFYAVAIAFYEAGKRWR